MSEETVSVSHTRWPAMYRLADNFNGFLWQRYPLSSTCNRLDLTQPFQVWGSQRTGAGNDGLDSSVHLQDGASNDTGSAGHGGSLTYTSGRGGGSSCVVGCGEFPDIPGVEDDATISGEPGDVYARGGDGGSCVWQFTGLNTNVDRDLKALQKKILGPYNNITLFGTDDKQRPKLWGYYARPNIGEGGAGGDCILRAGDAGTTTAGTGARGGDIIVQPGMANPLSPLERTRGHICFARGSTDAYNADDPTTWSQTLGRREGLTLEYVTEQTNYGDISSATMALIPLPNSIYQVASSTGVAVIQLCTATALIPERTDYASGTFDYASFSFFIVHTGSYATRIEALDGTVILVPYTPFDLVKDEVGEFLVVFRDDAGGQRAYVYYMNRAKQS